MEDFMIKTWTDTRSELDAYFDRLADELHDRIESGEVSEPSLTPPEIIRHAYMLTQYQYGGGYSVSYDDFARYVQRECMDDPSVADVNAHLEADCRDEDLFYVNDTPTFNEVVGYEDAWDIASRIRNGEWNPSDEYFYFDGYANIRSCTESEIIRNYKEETNKYLFEISEFHNDYELEAINDDSELIIEYCNRMLRDGF